MPLEKPRRLGGIYMLHGTLVPVTHSPSRYGAGQGGMGWVRTIQVRNSASGTDLTPTNSMNSITL